MVGIPFIAKYACPEPPADAGFGCGGEFLLFRVKVKSGLIIFSGLQIFSKSPYLD